MDWTPITLKELRDKMQSTEMELRGEVGNFWELVKIPPEKWEEKTFGKEGGGFWVVGLIGNKALWYNDIEEGFNLSDYKKYGEIEGYFSNQDELSWAVTRLFNLIKLGEKRFRSR